MTDDIGRPDVILEVTKKGNGLVLRTLFCLREENFEGNCQSYPLGSLCYVCQESVLGIIDSILSQCEVLSNAFHGIYRMFVLGLWNVPVSYCPTLRPRFSIG